MSDETTKYIIIRETVMESVVSDMVTIASAVALIGLGVVLSSNAMQWAGGFFWAVLIVHWAAGNATKMTSDEAIAEIEAIQKREERL